MHYQKRRAPMADPAAAGLLLGVGATLHHAAQFAEAQAASQSSDGGHASNTETPRS